MTVKDIFDFLNFRFPVSNAMDFDNVGILVGDPEARVEKALVVLDCTTEAVKLAIKENCSLIITHHPVIFEPLKNVLSNSIVFELIKNGLSVISMHTNLDIGVGGVNDTLCEALEVQNIIDFEASDGFTIKSGIIPKTTAEALAGKIKDKIGGVVKFTDGGRPISRLLICGGSGGNYIEDAINHGFDALITSDVKHHQFLIAKNNGISLFDAGHFNTEDVVIEPLKNLLSKEFKNIDFLTLHPADILYK